MYTLSICGYKILGLFMLTKVSLNHQLKSFLTIFGVSLLGIGIAYVTTLYLGSNFFLFIGNMFLLAGCAFFFSRQMIFGLKHIVDIRDKAQSGFLSIQEIEELEENTIQDLKPLLAGYKEILKQLEKSKKEYQALQDLARESAVPKTKKTTSILQGFEHHILGILGTTTSSANHVEDQVHTVSSLMEITKQQAGLMNNVSQETTLNVQTVATAAEELSTSISEISKHVTNATVVAKQASEAVNETNERVNSLAVAAGKINDVVNFIHEIASQTHLLALNATIEAARAGESGKGFAVVASEVKNLANQTAKATDDITAQVLEIQTATHDAVSGIKRISEVIHDVEQISVTIAIAVQEQSAATHEIASNVQHLWQGTRMVTDRISSVTGTTSEVGDAIHEINKYTTNLSGNIEELKSTFRQFISDSKLQ